MFRTEINVLPMPILLFFFVLSGCFVVAIAILLIFCAPRPDARILGKFGNDFVPTYIERTRPERIS
jgi:hypothetical protein